MQQPVNRSLNGKRRERVGQNHQAAKYSDETVEQVRRLYKTGEYGYKKLSEMFGVPRSTVREWVRYEIRLKASVDVDG